MFKDVDRASERKGKIRGSWNIRQARKKNLSGRVKALLRFRRYFLVIIRIIAYLCAVKIKTTYNTIKYHV
jgi:hypothetical protein